VTTELEYEAWRVDCPHCGVTIEIVRVATDGLEHDFHRNHRDPGQLLVAADLADRAQLGSRAAKPASGASGPLTRASTVRR
jgi:hypothetical protein